MKKFWEKFGYKFLSKIEKGTLEVIFTNGKKEIFGDNTNPKATLHIFNNNFFKRVLLYGDIGFAESYMDEEFETNNLTNLISLALLNSNALGTLSSDERNNKLINLFPQFNRFKHILRKNSKTNSKKISHNIMIYQMIFSNFF